MCINKMTGKRAEITIETLELTIIRKTRGVPELRYCSNCGHPVGSESIDLSTLDAQPQELLAPDGDDCDLAATTIDKQPDLNLDKTRF